MKHFKLSMLVMLSAMAMAFTSCLDSDGDNTQYVYGTGTALSSNSIILDNGLTVSSSSVTLTSGERYYIMAQCTQDVYEDAYAKLQAGSRASLTSDYVSGGLFFECDLEEDSDDDVLVSTNVDGISWFTYGAFGNGYMNFLIKASYYVKTENSSSDVVTPECKATWSYQNNTLYINLAYNNRAAETVEEDGTQKSGYSLYSGQDLPFTLDVRDIYYKLANEYSLNDSDEINLVVRYYDEEALQSSELTGKFGTSTNYFTLGSLKRIYSY